MMSPLSEFASDAVRKNFIWAEQFSTDMIIEAVRRLMRDATEREDFSEGIDSVVPGFLQARRVRRIESLEDAEQRDITIRAFVKSGAATEIDKLRDGSFRATVYSFRWINQFNQLRGSAMIDVRAFVEKYLSTPHGKKDNGDGTGFYFWSIDRIDECVVFHDWFPFEWPEGKREKCSDCWQNRDKWIPEKFNGRTRMMCRVCGRFVGYVRD